MYNSFVTDRLITTETRRGDAEGRLAGNVLTVPALHCKLVRRHI